MLCNLNYTIIFYYYNNLIRAYLLAKVVEPKLKFFNVCLHTFPSVSDVISRRNVYLLVKLALRTSGLTHRKISYSS